MFWMKEHKIPEELSEVRYAIYLIEGNDLEDIQETQEKIERTG